MKLKLLWSMWKKRIPLFLISTAGISVRNFIIIFLNAAISSYYTSYVSATIETRFLRMLFLSLLVVLFFSVSDGIFQFLQNVSTQRMMTDLRNNMLEKILRSDLTTISHYSDKSELITRINSDTNVALSFLRYQFLTPLIAVVSGIGASWSILMIKGSVILLLTAYSLGIILLLAQTYLSKCLAIERSLIQQKKTELVQVYLQGCEKTKVIHLCQYEEQLNKLISSLNQQILIQEKKVNAYSALNDLISNIPALVQYGIGIALGAVFYAKGILSIANVVFLAPLMAMIINMCQSLGNTIISFRSSLVGFNRIFEILLIPQEINDPSKRNYFETQNKVLETRYCLTSI